MAGYQAEHVVDLGLATASDREIWARASELGATIVTKDEDFLTLRALRYEGPPIVWVRIGNTTREHLIAAISSALPDIVAALERGEAVVEIASS